MSKSKRLVSFKETSLLVYVNENIGGFLPKNSFEIFRFIRKSYKSETKPLGSWIRPGVFHPSGCV
jgi:hypothetical protein